MKLGIVATHESAQPHVEGLAAAAAARGWECRCFLTESGVRLARSPALAGLTASGKLRLDVCEHSWHHYGGTDAPAGANMGTQFQNAQLAGDCDRVVVIGGAVVKSILVVAKNNQAEALRVAAGLTLLSAPVSVAVVGALADTPAITEQKEVLEFAEVPCEEVGEGAEGNVKLARAIAAADHVYVI